MLRFTFWRMLSKKWMAIALIIGNILIIGVASANPIYSSAVMQKVFKSEFESVISEDGIYPGRVSFSSGSLSSGKLTVEEAKAAAEGAKDKFGVDEIERTEHLYLGTLYSFKSPRDFISRSITIGALTDLESHVTIKAGRMYSDKLREDGTLEIVVTSNGLSIMNFVIGETITIPGIRDESGEPIKAEVVGVYEENEGDLYWTKSYPLECFISEDVFSDLFIESGGKYKVCGTWDVMLDYTQMQSYDAQRLLKVSRDYMRQCSSECYTCYFEDVLEKHISERDEISFLMFVLQVPVFVLIGVFIFMVSRQMASAEQNEISMLKSRGANNFQVLFTYFIQSVIIGVFGIVFGIPLGAVLCQVIGSSNSFLEFVDRSALNIHIDGNVFMSAFAGFLFSVAVMVVPVMKYAGFNIVIYKRKKNRKKRDKPLWQKLFIDVIMIAFSCYGLVKYNMDKDYLVQRILSGEASDPVLYLCSSVFMMGMGLFALRILPMVVSLISKIFAKKMGAATYTSFANVIRMRSNQGFIVVFLILTISLGMFSSQMARTINLNEERNIIYKNGADVVLEEKWNTTDNSGTSYQEPDFSKYLALESTEAATKVYDTTVSVSKNNINVNNVRLMGISTKEFGKTANFESNLLSKHWYNYLNAISQDAKAVLISENLAQKYSYELGDDIEYKNAKGITMNGTICGIVEYWPSYEQKNYNSSIKTMTDSYLIVANLTQVQENFGLEPYEVWIKTSNINEVYDLAKSGEVMFTQFTSKDSKLIDNKNDPIIQGTNGMLTIGFVVTLVLCTIGFIIYWIVSVKTRLLEFGILRAMGMTMGEVFRVLINEQLLISGISVLLGTLVGYLTGICFVPLIQMASATQANALPFMNVISFPDMVKLFAIVLLMIAVCMIAVTMIVKRMKITQVLKLGED